MLPRPKCCAARGVSTASPGRQHRGDGVGEPGTIGVPRANPVEKYPMLGAPQPPGIIGDGCPLPAGCAAAAARLGPRAAGLRGERVAAHDLIPERDVVHVRDLDVGRPEGEPLHLRHPRAARHPHRRPERRHGGDPLGDARARGRDEAGERRRRNKAGPGGIAARLVERRHVDAELAAGPGSSPTASGATFCTSCAIGPTTFGDFGSAPL